MNEPTVPTANKNQSASPGTLYERPQNDISIADLYNESKRYWVALVSIPLIFGVSAAYLAMSEPSVFEATSTLLIEKAPVAREPLTNMSTYVQGNYDYFLTQYALINSRSQVEKLVDQLRLDKVPEFSVIKPAWHLRVLEKFGTVNLDEFRRRQDPKRIAIARAQRAANVVPERRTQLAGIKFQSQNRELAVRGANVLAEQYIDSILESRLASTQRATRWLNEKLSEISTDLEKAELELQQFREREDLVDIGGARSLIQEELSDLSSRLREATRTRVDLQNSHLQAATAGSNIAALENSSVLLTNPLVKQAQDRFLGMQAEFRSLQQRYGAKHPKITAARTRLSEVQTAYHDQLRIAADNLRERLEIAQRNERELKREVERARARVRTLDRQQFRLGVLQREVESGRQLYEVFLDRFKASETASNYNEVYARIVDPAVTATKIHPRPVKSLMVSSGIGLMFALGLIILRVQLRSRIETPEDIEAITSIPVIGTLPTIRKNFITGATSFNPGKNRQYSEAARSIQAAIYVSDVDRSWKCLMVTSPAPGDGKTTLAHALAKAFSGNEKVLLIETDLRRATLHRHTGQKKKGRGLTDVLSGTADLKDVLIEKEDGPDIIFSGTPPANPAEVLSSEKFRQLVAGLIEQYDRVIFDTPPISAVGDALLLLPRVDGLILVARAEQTHSTLLRSTIKRLLASNTKIIGIVLNGMHHRFEEYGYPGLYRYY